MGRHTKAIVIMPDRPPEVRRIEEGKKPSDIKTILGGAWLEGVDLGVGVIGYIDDDGVAKALPDNPLAMRLWHGMQRRVVPGKIPGTMVVCGVNEWGEHVDVPDWVIDYAEALWRDPSTPHPDPRPTYEEIVEKLRAAGAWGDARAGA
jgi:hypothetical protein